MNANLILIPDLNNLVVLPMSSSLIELRCIGEAQGDPENQRGYGGGPEGQGGPEGGPANKEVLRDKEVIFVTAVQANKMMRED